MAAELTRTIPSGWQDVILVCRKCSKRQGGGFGPQGGKPLAKALRKHLGVKKGRKASVGIVEVGCLGVCPQDAVTLVKARDSLRWRLVPPAANLHALAHALCWSGQEHSKEE